VPNAGALKQGTVPLLKLGAYDLPSVPGLSGDEPVKEREEGLGIELDGLVGSGLLANFLVTLADAGRTMWLEDMPREALAPPDPTLNATIEESDDLPDDAADEDDAPKGKPGKAGAPQPGNKPEPKPAGGAAKPTAAAPATSAKAVSAAPAASAKAPIKP
jgi:hypothetical protein